MTQLTNLQISVIEQLGCDNGEELLETFKDINSHGAQSGFHGFTYYADTYQFTRNNISEILEELRGLADDCGDETLTDCLSSFRCLKGLAKSEIESALMDDESGARHQVYNALAWFTLETVAARLEDFPELYADFDVVGLR